MSFYHGDSSRKYTYLKITKEQDHALSPKEAISVFFDKSESATTRNEERGNSCLATLINTDSR